MNLTFSAEPVAQDLVSQLMTDNQGHLIIGAAEIDQAAGENDFPWGGKGVDFRVVIAFAEKYFLNEREWSLPESFQGAGALIAIGTRHDPQESLINPIE